MRLSVKRLAENEKVLLSVASEGYFHGGISNDSEMPLLKFLYHLSQFNSFLFCFLYTRFVQ